MGTYPPPHPTRPQTTKLGRRREALALQCYSSPLGSLRRSLHVVLRLLLSVFLGFGGFVTSLRMAGAGRREAGMTGGAVGGAVWAG